MIDLEAEQQLIKAEEAKVAPLIARGRANVTLPSLIPFGLGCAFGLYLARRESWLGLVVLFGGIFLMWPVHAFLLRRWWRWATSQDVDLSLLRDAAEEAQLIWPRSTFFGRRESVKLDKLTESNSAIWHERRTRRPHPPENIRDPDVG